MDETVGARRALRAWESAIGSARLEPMPVVNNQIWLVVAEDGRRFVLKLLPEYPPGVGPIEEFRVLTHLQESGIPVALPVVTDAATIHAPIGDRFYALAPYLPHDPGDHETGPDPSGAARAVGAAIARIGVALAGCPWAVRSYVDDPARETVDESLPKLPGELNAEVAPFAPRLRAAVIDLPVQRTVGDCNAGNVLLKGSSVTGFIDLDHLPLGPRIRDLSYYVASRLRRFRADGDGNGIEALLAVLPDYLAGYREICPLTDRELSAFVPLMLLVEIDHASWFVHGRHPDPELYARSAATISWMLSHLDRLTSAAGTPPVRA